MSAGSIGEAVITVGADASGLGADVEKQSKSPLSAAGAAVGKAFGDALATTVKVTGAAIGTTLGVALVKGFGRLEAIDTATAKLTGLGHSADQIASIMTAATAAVKGTAYGLGDAASAAAQFSAAGIPLEGMQRSLSILASTAAVAGTDLGDMTAIFGKVAATGKLTGEVVAQLSDRGVPALSILSKQLGVTAGDVSTMVSAGQIDFETFQTAMESSLGPAAAAMGQSFSGMVDNVGAALGRFGAAAQAPAFAALKTLFPALISLLDQMTAAVTPVATVVGDLLAPAMAKLASFLSGISFDVTAQGASSFLAALGPLLPVLGASLGFIGPMVQNIPILGTVLGGLTGPVGLVIGALTALIALKPETLLKGFDSLASAVPDMLAGLADAASTLLPQMLGRIAGNLPIFINGILGLLQQIIPAIVGLIPTVVQAFAMLVPTLVSALLAAVPTLIAAALQLFSSIVTVLPQVIASLVAMLPQVATALLSALPMIIDSALQLFQGVITGLLTAVPLIISAVLELLPQLVTSLVSMLPTIIDSALELFLGVVTGLITAVPQILTALLQMLPQLIGTLIGMIPALINGAVRLFTGIVSALPQIIPQLIGALIGLAPVIVQTLIGLVPQLVRAGVDLIGGLVQGLWKAAGSVGGALLKIAQDAVGSFLSFLGIHSPSKLFEGFGENTMQGYVKGMEALQKQVATTMVATIATPVSAIAAGPAVQVPGAGSGMTTTGSPGATTNANVTTNITLDGGDPYAVAREVADRIAAEIGDGS